MSKEVTAAQVADKVVDKVDVMIQNAAANAGNIFEAASNIVNKAIEQYGQSAIDAILWVVRIDAMQTLLLGWLMFIAMIVVPIVMYKKVIHPIYIDETKNCSSEMTGTAITSLITAGFVIIMFLSSFWKVTDVWLYTAVAKPELYLVKQVVDVVKKKANEVAK